MKIDMMTKAEAEALKREADRLRWERDKAIENMLRAQKDVAQSIYNDLIAMCGEQGGVVYPQDIEGICVAWGAKSKEGTC